MIEYLIVYLFGFFSPYILKFIVFPQFAKTDTWKQIKAYMDRMEGEKKAD